ncbi:MAG: hypothetical protein AB7G12_10235 [Thermoanaerobaculia bacterium]
MKRIVSLGLAFQLVAGLFHWAWIGLEYAGLGMRRFGPVAVGPDGDRFNTPYLSLAGVLAALGLCVATGLVVSAVRVMLGGAPPRRANVMKATVIFGALSACWMAVVYPEAHFLFLPLRVAEIWDAAVVRRVPILEDIHWHRGFRSHLIAMSLLLALLWLLGDAVQGANAKAKRAGASPQ